jgi:hypothetical protein
MKRAITSAGDGPFLSSCPCVAVFWLHHPLNVGTRVPTLIRRRLNRGEATDTTGAETRRAVWGEAMELRA